MLQLDDDACYDLKKARSTKYRTHLYYLNYVAGKTDENDVTWVAQLSLDRLQMVEPLSRLWEGNPVIHNLMRRFPTFVYSGPISLTLYLSDAEAQQLQYYVYESDYLSTRKNIAYHVVFKQGVSSSLQILKCTRFNRLSPTATVPDKFAAKRGP